MFLHSKVSIICFSRLSCMYRSLSSKLSCRSFSHILLSERRFISSLETWRTKNSLTEFSWWFYMIAVSQWLTYNFLSSTLMIRLLMQIKDSLKSQSWSVICKKTSESAIQLNSEILLTMFFDRVAIFSLSLFSLFSSLSKISKSLFTL